MPLGHTSFCEHINTIFKESKAAGLDPVEFVNLRLAETGRSTHHQMERWGGDKDDTWKFIKQLLHAHLPEDDVYDLLVRAEIISKESMGYEHFSDLVTKYLNSKKPKPKSVQYTEPQPASAPEATSKPAPAPSPKAISKPVPKHTPPSRAGHFGSWRDGRATKQRKKMLKISPDHSTGFGEKSTVLFEADGKRIATITPAKDDRGEDVSRLEFHETWEGLKKPLRPCAPLHYTVRHAFIEISKSRYADYELSDAMVVGLDGYVTGRDEGHKEAERKARLKAKRAAKL